MVTKGDRNGPSRRSAFTMIELIYAIVIMGIVFVTLPMILINNNKNVEQNLLQETILITMTKMNDILSFRWDERSWDDSSTAALAKTEVVDTTSAVTALQRSTSDFRVGHFQQPLHRRMRPAADTARVASTLGSDALPVADVVADDIDDFIIANDPVIIHGVGSPIDYKYNYYLDTSVTYVDDNAFRNGTNYNSSAIDFSFDTTPHTTSTTSLKQISLLVKADKNNDGDGNDADEQVIRLRAFSANIGETDIYMRTY